MVGMEEEDRGWEEYEFGGDDDESPRTRGRPRMSRLSLPIFLGEGQPLPDVFSFQRLADFSRDVEKATATKVPAMHTRCCNQRVYKLRDGLAVATRLATLCGLSSATTTNARRCLEVGLRERHEYQKRLVCLDLRHLLDVPAPTDDPPHHPRQKLGETKKCWRALYLRLVLKKSLGFVASATGMTKSSICKLVRCFWQSPQHFQEKHQASSVETTRFSALVKRQFQAEISSGSMLYRTKKSLVPKLRQMVGYNTGGSDRSLLKAAVAELGLRKVKINMKRALVFMPDREPTSNIVYLFLIQEFFQNRSCLIFDSTCFQGSSIDQRSWAPKGATPTADSLSFSLYRHVHVFLSRDGIEAMQCSKGSTDAMMINNIMRLCLSEIKLHPSSGDRTRFIFLDNAPVHRLSELEKIAESLDLVFVLNLPNNPSGNPVEWLFGCWKAKFRNLHPDKVSWTPTDILQALVKLTKEEFNSTMTACLKYIVDVVDR